MKKATKWLLIICAVFAIAGVALCAAGMLMGGSLKQIKKAFSVQIGGEDLTDAIDDFKETDSKWKKYSFSDVQELDIDFSSGVFQMKNYDGKEIRVYILKKDNKTRVHQSGDKLVIDEKERFHLPGDTCPVMMLVPKGMKFRRADLDFSAGSGKLENLSADQLSVDMSAGELELLGKTQTRKSEWNVSAGSITAELLQSRDTELDVSAGSLELQMEGESGDYYLKGELTAGDLTIDGHSQDSLEDEITYGKTSAKNHVEFDVSAGEINITFSK